MQNIVIMNMGEVNEYIRLNHIKLLLYRQKNGQTVAISSGSNYYVRAKPTVGLTIPGTALSVLCMLAHLFPATTHGTLPFT